MSSVRPLPGRGPVAPARAGTRLPAQQPEPPAQSLTRRVTNALAGVLCIAFLIAAVVLAWPGSLGGPFRMVVVSGHSMEPGMHTGDLVLTVKRPAYEVGQVIVYEAHEDGQGIGNVVHRIVAVNPDGSFVAQGDNKQYRDPWDIPPNWVSGRVIIMVPKAYFVLSILRHPIFLAVMSGLLLTMFLWPADPLSSPPTGPPVAGLPPPQR